MAEPDVQNLQHCRVKNKTQNVFYKHSVGCVDESGRSFYSLVRPKKPKKVTDFITKLTGITRGEVLAAPEADEVFARFYDWLDKSEALKFYCYGD